MIHLRKSWLEVEMWYLTSSPNLVNDGIQHGMQDDTHMDDLDAPAGDVNDL